jgi:fructokinase
LVKVEAATIDVVDTIGAGDGFQAAPLFALHAIEQIRSGTVAQLNSDELGRVVRCRFASTCAAFTCSRAGADPSRQSDVDPVLSRLFVG